MTIHHRIAGGLVFFALFAWIISPLVSASAVATERSDVSIAISSGSHLTLIERAGAASATGHADGNLLCRHVFRLHIADIGLSCTAADAPRQMVRLGTE